MLAGPLAVIAADADVLERRAQELREVQELVVVDFLGGLASPAADRSGGDGEARDATATLRTHLEPNNVQFANGQQRIDQPAPAHRPRLLGVPVLGEFVGVDDARLGDGHGIVRGPVEPAGC
jgi:hypothetical protein